MISVISRSAADYPVCLEDLSQPPAQLFCIGDRSLFTRRMVAIVGTRDPTAYGIRTARAIATAMANAGICLVSGMARGIDAVVHRAALDNGGRTIAVLGTGVDVPYPAGHRELHRQIGESGLVVSEFGTGFRAHQGSFPRRNRIIAGLGSVTIVIEAGDRSGALITANLAADIGRPVAATPGPIDSPQSSGVNRLLRDGAIVIGCVADAMVLAGVPTTDQPQPLNLDETDARVWASLGGSVLTVDALALASSVTTRECLTAVTSLELKGMVECLVTGEVRRR